MNPVESKGDHVIALFAFGAFLYHVTPAHFKPAYWTGRIPGLG